MNDRQLQTWLNTKGACLTVDGMAGQKTRDAIMAVFQNKKAAAVTEAEIKAIADRLGGSVRQVKAVALVESGGAAFDAQGRPKILFERHYFWKLTKGAYGLTAFSNPSGGDYKTSSWEKLAHAACVDADAAFASCSWGKFQVMGAHWKTLGYASPIEMAFSTVGLEAAHYEMLARFIEANKFQDELRLISSDPNDCIPFAAAYNGPAFRKFNYHTKIARAAA